LGLKEATGYYHLVLNTPVCYAICNYQLLCFKFQCGKSVGCELMQERTITFALMTPIAAH